MARFAVCLVVVVAHAAPVSLIGQTLKIALSSGIASTLFFALSGYIICSTSGFWRTSFSTFAFRRFVRLLPVHWLSCLLLLPWVLVGEDRWGLAQLATESPWWLSGLQGFNWPNRYDLYNNLNSPAWSITPLLYGTLLLPLVKTRFVSQFTTKRLAAVMLLLWAFRLAATFAPAPPASGMEFFLRHAQPEPHMLEILLGGFAAVLLRKPEMARLVGFLSRDRVLILLVSSAVLLLLAAASVFGAIGAFYLVHGPIFPVMLLIVASAHANLGSIETASRKPWVKTAGELSLLIFLLHCPVLELLQRAVIRTGLAPGNLLELATTAAILVGSVALAWVLFPAFRETQNYLLSIPSRVTGTHAARHIPFPELASAPDPASLPALHAAVSSHGTPTPDPVFASTRTAATSNH